MPNTAFWTDKRPAPKCSSHALKAAPQQSPSGRLRNSKTPWPWRTERPPKTCCPEAWRPFWILVKTKRLQLLGLLLLLLLLLVLLELVPNVAFWADKKPAPKCSSRALKAAPQQSPSGRLRNSKTPGPWRTERPPKTCFPGAWRPFWILVKTKRLQLLGLLLLLLLLRAWELHSKVLAGGCETAKHHGPEGRNDLQKHAFPGLDVPSGFW